MAQDNHQPFESLGFLTQRIPFYQSNSQYPQYTEKAASAGYETCACDFCTKLFNSYGSKFEHAVVAHDEIKPYTRKFGDLLCCAWGSKMAHDNMPHPLKPVTEFSRSENVDLANIPSQPGQIPHLTSFPCGMFPAIDGQRPMFNGPTSTNPYIFAKQLSDIFTPTRTDCYPAPESPPNINQIVESLHTCQCKFCDRILTRVCERTSSTKQSVGNSAAAFNCKYCRKRFRLKYQQERHEHFHETNKLVKCDTCDRFFHSKSSRDRHQNSHCAASSTAKADITVTENGKRTRKTRTARGGTVWISQSSNHASQKVLMPIDAPSTYSQQIVEADNGLYQTTYCVL